MIDQYGWEPFQHWFCEPGDIPGENRSSCSFRNWWQANVGVGGSGVPLWRLPPKKVTQIERGTPIDEHLCDVCGKNFAYSQPSFEVYILLLTPNCLSFLTEFSKIVLRK